MDLRRTSSRHAFAALFRANAVYWPSIRPAVHRQLRRWAAQAEQIPDLELRRCALQKLHSEQLNCEVAATLAALAPARRRPIAIAAIVALQVMYDYLDGITELPNADRLHNNRQLYRAFLATLAQEPPTEDYYRYCSTRGDGGYLRELAATCSAALWQLPSAATVLPAATKAAARCAEAQSRSHSIPQLGAGQLAAWAEENALPGSPLSWWEHAAAGAASVLAMHALLTAAADPHTTEPEAHRIEQAYLPLCALSTLLDSLVDAATDHDDAHRFIAYYQDERHLTERLVAITKLATASASTLRHAGHHAVTVVGVAAYYLSAPLTPEARPVAEQLLATLRPLAMPILPLLRLWRGRPPAPASAVRAGRDRQTVLPTRRLCRRQTVLG